MATINKSAEVYRRNAYLNRGVDIETKEGSCKRYQRNNLLSARRDDRLTAGRPGKWLPYLPGAYSSDLRC
jgi:hypothetical protein